VRALGTAEAKLADDHIDGGRRGTRSGSSRGLFGRYQPASGINVFFRKSEVLSALRGRRFQNGYAVARCQAREDSAGQRKREPKSKDYGPPASAPPSLFFRIRRASCLSPS